MNKIQSIRGFNDILPQDTYKCHYVENAIKSILNEYNYAEIRLPILEKSDLFHRSVGESSDIVSKETYDFCDRSGENITMRPEGTAGCVRSVVENGMLRGQIQKLWYLGPMFRYERPQKGRYRQFYQLGVEIYGLEAGSIDLELLTICFKLWQNLGLKKYVSLEINNLGTLKAREQYTQKLVEYLKPFESELDDDSQKRLTKNPMRILDSKNKNTQKIVANAPKINDYLDEKSIQDFEMVKEYLDALGINYRVNSSLVRGLDYYSGLVFEWVTNKLGAQSAVCAGGRYDNLVQQLGGGKNFAIGFAMGMERIILLLESLNLFPQESNSCQMLVMTDKQTLVKAMLLTEDLKSKVNLNIQLNLQTTGLKSQFKKADKLGVKYALIYAENEATKNIYQIKFLQGDRKGEQVEINSRDLENFCTNL